MMRKLFIVCIVLIVHAVLFFTVTITTVSRQEREDSDIFKLVDVEEYVPPPPQPEEELNVIAQDKVAEDVVEVEEAVIEVPRSNEPTFLPQHKISVPPIIPVNELRKNIVYPPLANRQGIEGVVILELFIDAQGIIRRITVLKDPGYGLAEAAIAAFDGIAITPAMANEQPVAVRYRYPIRFQLK